MDAVSFYRCTKLTTCQSKVYLTCVMSRQAILLDQEIEKTRNFYSLLVERENDSHHLIFWSLKTLTNLRD